jgi:replicative DNA helicase
VKREQLEAACITRWERVAGSMKSERCVATLEIHSEATLDMLVASLTNIQGDRLRAMIEQRLRYETVSKAIGDLEEENNRLKAAVKKWGALAISRAEWRASEKEEAELEEDLR